MKALVFAGGYGTRLAPLTNNKQKCMIDVAGKPCLEHIIDRLNKHGVTEIIVHTHYRALDVMSYFKESVLYAYSDPLISAEDTIKKFRNWALDESLIVWNGDTLSNVNLSKLESYGGRIRLMDNKTPDIFGGVECIGAGWIKSNGTKEFKSDSTWWIDIGSWDGLRKARTIYEGRK